MDDSDSVVPQLLLCPICFEIPSKEIYQCINGHIVCSTCAKNLLECPQCRVRYERNKIRNRVLENLLESMKIDRSNTGKSKGNTTKLTTGWISTKDVSTHHPESSSFRSNSISLCETLGYSCGFRLNSKRLREGLKHLQDAHNAVVFPVTATGICIHLEGIKEISLNKKSLWTPVILNFKESFLLFLAMFDEKDKSVSLTCVKLNDNFSAATGKTLITFRVKSIRPNEIPDLMFTTAATGIGQAINAIKYPQFSFKLDYLIHNFVRESALVTNCSLGRENTRRQDEEEKFFFILSNSSKRESVVSSWPPAPMERVRAIGGSGPIQDDQPRRMAWIVSENVVNMNYAVKASVGSDGVAYVVRASHEGGKIPGRLQSGGSCLIPYYGKEIRKDQYEILTGPRNAYTWVKTRFIHRDAIRGGYQNGNTYFIGRTLFRDNMVCGKVLNGVCYIPYGGYEQACNDYELLILTTEGKQLNSDLLLR